MALIMGEETGKTPPGEGTRNKGEEGGALMEDKRSLRADTGQIGEDLRKGIWITWYLEDPCIALAHFTMIWAPGDPKIMSLRRKWREGSNNLEEEGARLERRRNPKKATRKMDLYRNP